MKEKSKNLLQSFFGIKIRLWAVLLACAIFAGGGYYLNARKTRQAFGGSEGYAAAQKYLSVQKVVDENFVGEENNDAMSDAACAAMVKSLGDQWSYYMTASEYEAYKLYSANQYQGIGVTISAEQSGDGYEITSVSAGSPAEAAGIKAGDVMLAVGGQSVKGLTVDEVRNLIRSHLNETVTLSIKSGGTTADVSVDCTVIYKEPVTYELKDKGVGFIRIENFESGAGDKAVSAVDDLLSQGATSLVFDVRGNPGGLLSELLKILDHLLPEGDLFVSVNEAGEENVTKSDAVCIQVPMAVLVNADSYSAAEFFAAALKEYNWATVVGEQTTGKGRSQITVELPDGSAVHISNNKYLTPLRVDLSEQGGLFPDVPVVMTSEGDAQLDAAIAAVVG